jgi:hypothetical protein
MAKPYRIKRIHESDTGQVHYEHGDAMLDFLTLCGLDSCKDRDNIITPTSAKVTCSSCLCAVKYIQGTQKE